jgi:hypothetical protein
LAAKNLKAEEVMSDAGPPIASFGKALVGFTTSVGALTAAMVLFASLG